MAQQPSPLARELPSGRALVGAGYHLPRSQDSELGRNRAGTASFPQGRAIRFDRPGSAVKKRIAVIGSGISGLSVGYYLSRKHEVHVFERDNRLGGHTHTVVVESAEGLIQVDTGFIVHNDRTYPNFCRLLEELGVETQPSDMSFAVTEMGGQFEYSSRGLGGF